MGDTHAVGMADTNQWGSNAEYHGGKIGDVPEETIDDASTRGSDADEIVCVCAFADFYVCLFLWMVQAFPDYDGAIEHLSLVGDLHQSLRGIDA